MERSRIRKEQSSLYYMMLLIMVVACSLFFGKQTTREDQMQKELASHVLRLRVVAQSNKTQDQEEKIKVKNLVLDVLRKRLSDSHSLEEAKITADYYRTELEELIQTRSNVKKATAELKTVWFPERRYGSFVFPMGEYETLQITLGEGRGRNWWCVLYPSLCFPEAVKLVDENGEEGLTPQDIDLLLHPVKTRIRLRLAILFGTE